MHWPDAGPSPAAFMPESTCVAARSIGIRVDYRTYLVVVMDARETMNVSLGRTSLVVAAGDGPGG
jgi:hypothetical protein